MEIGKAITNTCHESYIRTATHLGPEKFGFVEIIFVTYFLTISIHIYSPLPICRFSQSVDAKSLSQHPKDYILRPETIESYFILWRLTHDQKYRDWAWDAAQAIEKYCRTSGGFSGIRDVYSKEPQKNDIQESFFLAEVLKVYHIFEYRKLFLFES